MLKSRFFKTVIFCFTLVLIVVAGTAAVSGSPADPFEPGFLTGPAQGEPLDIALNYLFRQATKLGLQDEDVDDLVVINQYTSRHNGVTHIYLQQRYAGIKVYNAIININVASDGSIISMGNRFMSGLAATVNTAEPLILPEQAVRAAAANLGLVPSKSLAPQTAERASDGTVTLGDGGISLEPIPVKLMYQPLDNGAVRLAWDLSIYELDAQDWWSIRIDAVNGLELDRANLVLHDTFASPISGGGKVDPPFLAAARPAFDLLSDGQYKVYAEPLESPNYGGRTIQSSPADVLASPYGWHDTNGSAGAEFTITRGNNVNAYTDTNGDNISDPGSQPDGGPGLVFDFPINFSQQPSSYRPAAVTNLFYWNNLIHDVWYRYGFDEVSGNFQENNYGRGGSGSDSVNAEAQDGGDMNNANFATPVEGGNPRMQMYLWIYTNPLRDGDLDNGIIIHEYGHGISQRLTGGSYLVSCLNNAEQPGEGWSDWFNLVMTIESGDTDADRRGIGTYVLGQSADGDGIRAYPYSTDMAIDPRTYEAIKTASVPHGVGSTWAAMLWEVTWALIDRYGFDPDLFNGSGGNNMAMQLVIDGLKQQPCSPGFVDARDAILQADLVNQGGANQCLLWQAFAKRGLGYSADQGDPGSRSDGTQAFDLPLNCQQTLKISKTASPSPVDPGGTLTYSLLVENDTTGSLTGVTVTDNVPAGTTYVADSATCGGSEANDVVTFNLETMASGATQTCTFQVLVDPGRGSLYFLVDDMENGSDAWTAPFGEFEWHLLTTNPHSPSHAWFADDIGFTRDQILTTANPISLSGQPLLTFWHHYNTESSNDGGVVEISANGGPWTDLGPYMIQNGYNSVISTLYGSSIGGRQAFSGDSKGYLETVVDLSSFTGSSVRVRFRMATDSSVGDVGWYVDDVVIADEDMVSNTACVTADGGDNDCDMVTTLLNEANGSGPAIAVSPPTLSGVLNPGESSSQILTITNSGDANLTWDMTESGDACNSSSELSWVSALPTSGVAAPEGNSVIDVVFDSSGSNPGTYTGSLCISSNDPAAPQIEVLLSLVVSDPAAAITQLAAADVPGAGTVAGNYTDTHEDDNNYQSITERESGGKPSKRHDYLEHSWTFQVQSGSAHTFNARTYRSGPGGDNFVFAYSSDGQNFVNMFTVNVDDETAYSFELPAGLSGTVTIRVSDTDQKAGNINFDSLFVDYLAIVTQPGEPPVDPPGGALHVDALSGSAAPGSRGRWEATATITVHDQSDIALSGILVAGTWSSGASGSDTCTTDANGQCPIIKGNIKSNVASVTFTVDSLSLDGYTYEPGSNHATSINVGAP